MVDLIRAGKAPEVVRRKGAEGSLPLPEGDKFEILTLLAASPETDLRKRALETLRTLPRAEVLRVIASPQTAPDVLRYAAEHLLPEREELREPLLWNPSLPAEAREPLQKKPAPKPAVEAAPPQSSPPQAASLPPPPVHEAPKEPPATFEPSAAQRLDDEHAAVELLAKLAAGAKIEDVTGAHVEAPPEVTKRDDDLTPKDRETLIEKINRMSVVEKIKAALTGNMETRAILIRDSNKIISRAVLQSPKISETEAETYAAAKNVSEEVLRLIASNRKFMKSYVVVRALVNNPRAPIDVTMRLLPRVNDRDLKGLALNHNVPEVIRGMAIKTIKQKEEATKPKLPGKH
jgi:hypothetical protein